jgi:hypothetical protein
MKKIYVQIIDIVNGASQYCKIEEPISEEFIIDNALKRFGLIKSHINWLTEHSTNQYDVKVGEIPGTSKVVTVLILDNEKK